MGGILKILLRRGLKDAQGEDQGEVTLALLLFTAREGIIRHIGTLRPQLKMLWVALLSQWPLPTAHGMEISVTGGTVTSTISQDKQWPVHHT